MYDKSEITSKLEELRDRDPGLTVFGAKLHGYVLNPVLTDSEAARIEAEHGIGLPDDYRWFLTRIGNGGAGPAYGIMTLQQSVQEVTSWLDDDEEYEDAYEDYLGAPFEPPKTLERARRMDYFAPGMIPVSDAGCCMYYQLCVSGVERGNMWYWSNDNMWTPVPPADRRLELPEAATYEQQQAARHAWYECLLSDENDVRLGFMDWYLRWLDDALKTVGSA